MLLLHAYTFPRHEAAVRDLCRDMGFTQARRGQIFAVKLSGQTVANGTGQATRGTRRRSATCAGTWASRRRDAVKLLLSGQIEWSN